MGFCRLFLYLEVKSSNLTMVLSYHFIEKISQCACVVDADSTIRRYSVIECNLEWKFTRAMSSLGSGHIKNLYVNPNFGKEGLQSDQLELHCTLIN